MTTASRFFVAAVLALRVAAQGAASDINGVYHGSYDGPQGKTLFELSLTQPVEGTRGNLTGVFTSQASTNELTGFYSPPAHRFQLRSNIDRTARPGSRDMLVINGTYDP